VVGLLPPLLYFALIIWKQWIGWIDAVVLIALYLLYLYVLLLHPPQEAEQVADAPAVARWAYRQRGWRQKAAIGGLFAAGGVLLFVTAHPFLESMLALAGVFGVSQFVLVQWVAPFLSEFPEKVSAFMWARRESHAPMALMNMVSSNINQWTLLVAMLPVVLSFSMGGVASLPLDSQQKLEVLMTMGQQLVGMLFLVNMELAWWEALALFLLWFVQFAFSTFKPDLPFWGPLAQHVHQWVTITYYVWAGWELLRLLIGQRKPLAFTEFVKMWRQYVSAPTQNNG